MIKNKINILIIGFLSITCLNVYAKTNSQNITSSPLLGDASEYNLFIKDDIYHNGSIDGKIASGDDISIYYGDIGNSDHIKSSDEVVIHADDSVYLYGTYTNNTVSYGKNMNHKYSYFSNSVNNKDMKIRNSFKQLENLSYALKKSTETGQYNINNRTLSYSGVSNDNLHIIDINQYQLNKISNFDWNLKPNEKAVVNVSGKFIHSYNYMNAPGNVIFNFYDAKYIRFNNSFKGNILAPKANIEAICATITGQVIAKTWEGHGNLKLDTLLDPEDKEPDDPGNEIPVPIPLPLVLFMIGFSLLFHKKTINNHKGN